MATLEKLLERLTASNARIKAMDAKREIEMRKRDELVRASKTAGATWSDLTACDMSRATVTKALERQ